MNAKCWFYSSSFNGRVAVPSRQYRKATFAEALVIRYKPEYTGSFIYARPWCPKGDA
jgi:hypothetical protein